LTRIAIVGLSGVLSQDEKRNKMVIYVHLDVKEY